MYTQKYTFPQPTTIIKISNERTSTEWSAAMQRFSDCCNDEDIGRVLSDVKNIEVKNDSLGIGTPGRALLHKLCVLSSSNSVLSSVAEKVKTSIIEKYSAFLRCLGCDKTSNDINAFFLHLDGHNKNIKGTKRQYSNKENEYLAVLQLSILSSEVKSGRFDVKEELPQFVLGARNDVLPPPCPGRADWSRVCGAGNEGGAHAERDGEPQVGEQPAQRRNALLAIAPHALVHNPQTSQRNLLDATNKASPSQVKQERPASNIKENDSLFQIDHSMDTAPQTRPVSVSSQPLNVSSNKIEVVSNIPVEESRQDQIKLTGKNSDVKKFKTAFENVRTNLSVKSDKKYTNINTLDYLLKKSDSHCIGNNNSFTNGSHKSRDKNNLDNSSEEFREDNVTWRLYLYGTDSDIKKTKLDFNSFRSVLSQKTGSKFTNLATLEHLLDNSYLESVPLEPQQSNLKNSEAKTTTHSPSFQNNDVSERKYFLASWIPIDHFGICLNNHGKCCDGQIEIVASRKRIGFTCKERIYRCLKCKWVYKLTPTPTFQGRGVSDYSAALALHTSGGVVNNMKRLFKHLGLSLPNTNKFQKGSFKIDVLRKVVHKRATKAKNENIAKAVKKYGKGLLLNGDMAHNNRRNSKASTFTLMNPSTHEVLWTKNVHRVNEPISQKHEAAAATEVCEDIKGRGLWANVLCVDRGSKAKKPFKEAFSSPPLEAGMHVETSPQTVLDVANREEMGLQAREDVPVRLEEFIPQEGVDIAFRQEEIGPQTGVDVALCQEIGLQAGVDVAFHQEIGPEDGVDGAFRQKIGPQDGVDGAFRQEISPQDGVDGAFRQEIGPEDGVDGAFRQEIGPQDGVVVDVRLEIGPEDCMDVAFHQEIGPKAGVDVAFRQEIGPEDGVDVAFRQEIGPKDGVDNAFRQKIGPEDGVDGAFQQEIGPQDGVVVEVRLEIGPEDCVDGAFHQEIVPMAGVDVAFRQEIGPQAGEDAAICHEETGPKAGEDVKIRQEEEVGLHTVMAGNTEEPSACQPIIINDDNWHDLNKLEPYFKEEFKGLPRFDDKVILLRKHFYVSIGLCKISEHDYRDPEKLEEAKNKLRRLLLQSANHFQGVTTQDSDSVFHEGCDPSSKCRKKKNFILSCKGINSDEAVFLRSVIEQTHFFKHPENYLLKLNTSVVESSHRVQNIYRDKTTKYEEEEYDMRIDLATLHFDEVIKGKYIDGEKANATEYSKGPKHLEKQVITERRFIPLIDQDYFDEMMRQCTSDNKERSRLRSKSAERSVSGSPEEFKNSRSNLSLNSTNISSPTALSGLAEGEATDQVIELNNPEPINEAFGDLVHGSEIYLNNNVIKSKRNILLMEQVVNSNPTTTTAYVVYTSTPPTTVTSTSTCFTEVSMSSTSIQSLKASRTPSASQAANANVSGTTALVPIQLELRQLATKRGEVFVNHLRAGATCGGVVSQVSAGQITGGHMAGPRQISARRANVIGTVSTVRLAGEANAGQIMPQQATHQTAIVSMPQQQTVAMVKPPGYQSVIQRPLEHPTVFTQRHLRHLRHLTADTQKPLEHPNVLTQRPLEHPTILTQRHLQHLTVNTQKPLEHPTVLSQKPLENPTVLTQKPLQHPTILTQKPLEHPTVLTQKPLQHPTVLTQKPLQHPTVLTQKPLQHSTVLTQKPLQHPTVLTQKPLQHPTVLTQKPLQHPTVYTPRPLQYSAGCTQRTLEHPTVLTQKPVEHPTVYTPRPIQYSTGCTQRTLEHPTVLTQRPLEHPTIFTQRHLQHVTADTQKPLEHPTVYTPRPLQYSTDCTQRTLEHPTTVLTQRPLQHPTVFTQRHL